MNRTVQTEQAGDQTADEYVVVAYREGNAIKSGRVVEENLTREEAREVVSDEMKNTFAGGMMYDSMTREHAQMTGVRGA